MPRIPHPDGWREHAKRLLPPRIESAPRPSPKPATADPVKCPSCGAECPPDAKFCPQCGKELGDSGGGGDGAAARSFCAHVLALTEASTLDAARGKVEGWRKSAGELAAATSELNALQRERVLERAVAEGRITPAEAWSFSVAPDGAKIRSFSTWAGPPYDGDDPKLKGTGQTLEQLRGYVAGRPAGEALGGKPFTPADPPAGSAQADHARRTGRDPKKYAQLEAALASRQPFEVTK